ncbi:MAG: hypothetical protein NT062_07435 [Proteobacteria bacterium]|nr:hypothetical protein [Pseudomonadota bacterium]
MARLGERASTYLAKAQRPDGSFAGETGWRIQRLLAATAEATRAVASDTSTVAATQRAQGVRVRAAGMFERNFALIEDGYTAAVVLATGAVTGELATRLRAKVVAAIKTSDDGAKYLDVAADVVRADGQRPTTAEATAAAVLALQGDPTAAPLLADLGATLLGSYDPASGWGDGRANLVAMRAVLELFKAPVPADVTITLLMDGKEVTRGRLDRAAQRDVLALEATAPGLAGAHTWKVVAEPAVAGLGYALALSSWVPWRQEATNQGLELSLPLIMIGAVGKPIELPIAAIAPSGSPLHVTQALPAGVQLDTPSVQKLVTDGVIERFEASDGKLELFIPALAPGQTFAAKYRVIPTLAGSLHAAASTIELVGMAPGAGVSFAVAPTAWLIK